MVNVWKTKVIAASHVFPTMICKQVVPAITESPACQSFAMPFEEKDIAVTSGSVLTFPLIFLHPCTDSFTTEVSYFQKIAKSMQCLHIYGFHKSERSSGWRIGRLW